MTTARPRLARPLVAGTGAALLALALTACVSTSGSTGTTPSAGTNPAGASADLIAAAVQEGTVVLYGAPPQQQMQNDADAFTKAYGIKVEFTQLSGGALSARVNTELKAGTHAVDVVFASDLPTVDGWSRDGTLAPLLKPAGGFPGETDYTAVIQEGGAGIVYNTDLVSSPPKTWNDVLDPTYKGLVVMGDPATSPAYATTYVMLHDDPAHGDSYFQQLAALQPRVIGNGSVVQTVASGDAAIGFIVFPTNVAQVKQTTPDAPVAFGFLDVLALIPTVEAVLAHAPHPNAAQLFALYLMSRDGQTVHNQNQQASSVLGDLPGAVPAPPTSTVPQPTADDAAAKQQDIINLFHSLY